MDDYRYYPEHVAYSPPDPPDPGDYDDGHRCPARGCDAWISGEDSAYSLYCEACQPDHPEDQDCALCPAIGVVPGSPYCPSCKADYDADVACGAIVPPRTTERSP